jgi:hypothetical protein
MTVYGEREGGREREGRERERGKREMYRVDGGESISFHCGATLPLPHFVHLSCAACMASLERSC